MYVYVQQINLYVCTNIYLGLRRDDCLHETRQVKEAIRRLPASLQDERLFRITQALQLSMKKDILPKEEWTKFEEVGKSNIFRICKMC